MAARAAIYRLGPPTVHTARLKASPAPDGRVLEQMGPPAWGNLYRNIPGERDARNFESGVAYFK